MKKLISIFCLILLLSACAATTQYVQRSETNSDGTNYNSEAMAQIYVLRPSAFGSAKTYKIYQDEKFIGELGLKCYLSWQVDPTNGTIEVISKMENYAVLQLIQKLERPIILNKK